MAQRLSILNDSPKLLHGPKLLHELVKWEDHPQNCAIDFTDGDWRQCYSYRELYTCVYALTSQIQEALASSNSRTVQHVVPVLIPQAPALYISQLAILSSGGAFCPISLDSPRERIRFVINDVAAGLIITTSDFKDMVTWETGPAIILIDRFPSPSKQFQKLKVSYDVKPNDLAYIMYTSGSSGLPKGVRISHLAATQSLLAHDLYIPPFKRFLQFAAPSFDVSVFEILFPLVRASTLVGCNRSQLLDDLPAIINNLEIDAAELTPTVVGSLIQKRSNVPDLKLLLTIGEMLTSLIVKEFGGSKTQPYILYGMYGPTEAAIHCTIYPRMEACTKPGNIGIPFDTVSTYIADPGSTAGDAANLRFLPVGEQGELVLAGPQLAQGYLNQEDKSKVSFVHFKGKIYYRTGDKARQLEDGTIEILGRIGGGQVKIRGQRIELGEIEEAIYKHPEVKVVIATVLEGALLAFIITGIRGDELVISEEIMEICANWLPKSMLPSEIIFRSKFPYLPSGKVDKRRLEVEYKKNRDYCQVENDNTTHKTEETVQAILHEFLGPFSRNCRLASVGLDSLVAIKVGSRLRASGFNVSTISVLKARNLNALVQLCDSSPPLSSIKSKLDKESKKLLIPQVHLNGHADDILYTFPCTPLQLAMLSQTEVDEKAYQNWAEFYLRGAKSFEDVVKILQDLADFNPILRTGFIKRQGLREFCQFIRKKLPVSRIEYVTSFKYEYDRLKDGSLKYPVRFQILPGIDCVKVLMHIHHALYDAWSLELLLDDLDFLLVKNVPLKRPSFENIVNSYCKWENSTASDWPGMDYWKDHLAYLDPRQLPNFHTKKLPTPAMAIYRINSLIRSYEVESIARKLSISSLTIFQAAFALILSSYLGSSDICFGTVFSGRTLPIDGIESIVGPCLAILPIRTDINLSKTLSDFVQQLNYTNRKHLEHSEISLRNIKAAGGFEPQQVLFDTLLIWQQTLYPYDYIRNNVSLVNTVDNLEFKLVLEVIPHKENLELKANYQQQLIPELQIKILLHQVEQIARLIIKGNETPLGAVFNFISQNFLSIENENPETELPDVTLYSPVERIALEDPERQAISFANSSSDDEVGGIQNVSYSELNTFANRIAQHLVELGTVPDKLICICLEKSIELYTSILATTKAGAGWLPVMPDISLNRLNHILSEFKIHLVVTRSSLQTLFKSFESLKVVYIDEVDFSPYSVNNLSLVVSHDKLAYAIFTSGSTGQPKGVLLTQRNILSNLKNLESLYPPLKDTRLLQSCSQIFDVSVADIFYTWRVGGCLCSATKDVLFQDLEHTIRAMQITHLSLTPTIAALIDPDNVPCVKFMITAGEAMTSKVFHAWADRGLWNGYGPCETTNIVTVTSAITRDDLVGNIGYPLKNTLALVLFPGDGNGVVLTPRGGEGELCFGGSQIFRGYVEKNHEKGKIVEHPKFGRLYRTGDFGRVMPDGSFVYLGRKDDQVKIRGQRVELGEINNLIMSSTLEISNCTTILIENENRTNQSLVCFWTSRSKFSTQIQCMEPDRTMIIKLYLSLNATLPTYMIPSALIPVSFIPTTTSGKIDKSRLIKLFNGLSTDYLESTSQSSGLKSLERQLTSIESDIVSALAHVTNKSVSEIDIGTSFFSMGIDSISAIYFSRVLQRSSGYQVLISDILRFPTAVRLAEKIFSQRDERNRQIQSSKSLDFGFQDQYLSLKTAEYEKYSKQIQTIIPCTPLQEAILSAAELTSENIYDNYMVLKVSGNLKKLRQSLLEMVSRHEILRTCFESTEFQQYPYVQVVLKDYELQFGSISCLSERKLLLRRFEPPYSLDIMHSNDSKMIVISMHHALYDGAALSILFDEVQNLYYDRPLEPAISFTPFIQSIRSVDLNAADNFWSEVLKNSMFPKFKAQIKSQDSSFSNQVQSDVMGFSLKSINGNCIKYGTSLLSVLTTIWACIISERLGETDVCFGNVVNGRNTQIPGVDRLVAPCFNTIPFRLKNIEELSYLEAFRKFQIYNAEALPFQFTPLRRIQSLFNLEGSRLFDTLFILQQPSKKLDSSIWSIVNESGSMDFHLVCEIIPSYEDDTLQVTLHSDASIVSKEDVRAILKSFEKKLEEALQNPRMQLLSSAARFEILEKIERRENVIEISSESIALSQSFSDDEKKLRDIISHYSDVPIHEISRDTSIFRLGFDSISTIQLASHLKKHGINVSASNIFENNTIPKLCEYLKNNEDANFADANFAFNDFGNNYRKSICSAYGISPDEIEAIRPCTYVQQGMIARTLHTKGEEYMNNIWLEILPKTSISKLKDAWIAASQRHEMLRTGLASVESLEYPFVMITRRNFTLPWFETGAQAPNQLTINERLFHNPWSLNITYQEDKFTVQFAAHHALYDAQSIQMLLSDVARLYSDSRVEIRPPISSLLSAIIIQSQSGMKDKKAFWQKDENKIIINRFPDLTSLQNLNTSNHVQEYKSRAYVSELEAKCKSLGVTMQAAVHAAWARLLALYIGEPSTTFGVTLSGRSVYENSSKIPFPSIVTLPVRCNVSGTNAELLAQAMDSNFLMHRHQFTPLILIQKWTGYPNIKLFDTLLTFKRMPSPENNIRIPWKLIREDASVDYVASMEVETLTDSTLALRLNFRLDLIPVEQASIILEQYEALLLDLLSNPNNACDIPPQMETRLLSITPAKESDLPCDISLLHEFVERGARKHPGKIALEFATCLEPENFQSKCWTYKELDQNGNKVTNLLLNHDINPGEMIAICFDKCPEASFAIIGILKAGCAYVALDFNAPAERLRFIIKDSGAKIVLTAGEVGKKLTGFINEDVINLDLNMISKFSQEPSKLPRAAKSQDTSYCLYTSGTSGIPKGCLITHENSAHFMLAFSKIFDGHWSKDSKFLQFASFHFDVSVMEQFWSWSVGICVASAPRDLILENITGAIQILKVTHIDLTPSLARLINPDEVPLLRQGAFITGGEQLKQEILDAWGKYSCIYNGYGPTEVTIGCTMYPCVPKNGKPANIGPAYVNVGTFVMKPSTELPVLRGSIGELCVSGKLVGKGYLNRHDLTAMKFPTLKYFNERVYRTGDLVRILHDGSFVFHGRLDDQIKLRGQRLELGEINEVIKKYVDDIKEVITLVLRHFTQNKDHLVTFYVANSTRNSSLVSAIRDACKSRLPGYMVPTYFISIEKVPLNSNNKIDSKQLAAIYNKLEFDDLQRLSSLIQQDKHWSARQKEVVSKIASVIGVEASELKCSSNIFELGLDSISIVGFSRALQNLGFADAKLSIIKSNPFISDLVRVLLSDNMSDDEKQNAYLAASQGMFAFSQRHLSTVCNQLNIESMTIEIMAPCTPLQNGMIYRFLESKNALYFNKFQFKLDKNVDSQKLLAAWRQVASNLEVLRIKFIRTDDGFSQVVLKQNIINWEATKNYNTISKIESLRNPYCLSLEAEIMTLQIFHGLYDGKSLKMLLRHVIHEYNDFKDINYGPSYILSLPYGPLAKIPGTERFWQSHLRDWSPSPLSNKIDYSNDITAKYTIDNLIGFESLRLRLGVTPQAVIQACWIAVLQRELGGNLTIGIIISGRAIDFENADIVVGPLFNTVPFNIRSIAGSTISEVILTCHKFNMRMQYFQHTPLKDIQRYSPAKYDQPLFETLFVFQRSDPIEESSGLYFWTELEQAHINDVSYSRGRKISANTSQYSLVLDATLNVHSSNLSLTLVTKCPILTQDGAMDLLKQMEQFLRSTLHSRGENIVSNEGPRAKGLISTVGPKLNLIDKSSLAENEEFKWNHDTLLIKREIATLANLPYDAVNENSSIFELGLDSIDVIKLSSRLSEKGIEIHVSDIIQYQRIARMASKFSKKINHANKKAGKLLQNINQQLANYFNRTGELPKDVEEILPATPLQQSMFNEMHKSGFKRYFNVNGFRIYKGVNLDKLKEAIMEVFEESPIFRTTFYEVDDPKIPVRYAQVIQKYSRFEPVFKTMTSIIDKSFDEYLSIFKEDAITQAVKTGKLLHVNFVTLGNESFLFIAMSHALYDGASLRLIHADIKRAYNDQLSPRPDFRPYLDLVFQSTTEDSKKFWRANLSNLPSAAFPTQIIADSIDSAKVFLLKKRSNMSLSKIEALCKSFGITLQTLGQTCWAIVLSQIMKQLDVIFGSVLSCRDSKAASEVMFPLMNTVAVRSIIHGSLYEMLRYMQEISNNTRHYQHFPLGMAQVYALTSRENQTQTDDRTLFDTLFIYQGRVSRVETDSLYESVNGSSEVEFPVCVEMQIVDDEYILWTTACKSTALNLYETEALLEALETTLERIVSSSNSQSVVVDKDGISVCGLPKFSLGHLQRKVVDKRSLVAEYEHWSGTELSIRKALSEISGVCVENIRKEMSIFHLGLDSILVLKLPALMNIYGIKLSVSSILKDQTISAMARSAHNLKPDVFRSLNIDGILANATPSPLIFKELASIDINMDDIKYSMPAMAGQIYMIRQWQASQGALFYGTFKFVLPNPPEIKSLESAWSTVIARHDILRTGFVELGLQLYQVVFKNSQNKIIYCSDNDTPKTRKKNMDIRLPPVNIFVETFSDDRTILKLTIHHALYDAISLQILLRELQGLYRGELFELPPLEYRTFVAQSISISEPYIMEEKWKSYLKTKMPAPKSASNNIVKQRTELLIPATKIRNLKLQARDIGSSMDSLFLAALSKIQAQRLQRTSNAKSSNSVILGLYLANRAPYGEDLSSLVAPTLNLLPLCVHQPLEKSLESLALEIKSDIRKITSPEMISATLSQIYDWTGVQVDFFINILKSSSSPNFAGKKLQGPSSVVPSNDSGWESMENLKARSEVVDLDLALPVDVKYEAYLPSVNIELYHHDYDSAIDIGVFGPTYLISIEEAEELTKRFLEFWTL